MIEELITKLANHEEHVYEKVVILVDEYDSPILSVFNATKESLKVADENRANQLVDLTLREYSNVSETMNKLEEKYNGYSWDGNIRVYNPFNIAKHEIRINRDCIIPVSIENIQNSELPVSLFFQTGYLTIKQVEIVNKETEYLILEIEVRNSLMGELWANTFCIPEFNNDLASIPYFESQHASKYEGYYHSHMHMLVHMLRRWEVYISLEYKRWEGGNVKELIEEATNQIFEKKYFVTLTAQREFYSKTKCAIGCVFSTETRIISGVGIQEFTYEPNSLDRKELNFSLFE
ncbi:hypothetical protein C1646_753725 [Rhizophagus diaphanus]|nr:hypothetical protein C1646_753725 [Rhizophagus diaphanus] [Rhizophagus sp. MUCL 43196]